MQTLMLCSRRQLHISRRITAWLLLLLCAWMGTGGVLHHTEAPASVRQSHGSVPNLHQHGAMPTDTCAACEWTQGLQGRTLAVCRVPLCTLLPLPPRVRVSPISALIRTARLRPSRAPPALIVFC